MDSNVKALLAKLWKDEPLDLEVGTTFVDEVVTIHVSGSVVKHVDQMVAPTTSIPMIPVLALFWEKAGVSRDHALRMLREAITEAMQNGKSKDEQIESRIKDVEKAVEAVKTELIAKLPKQKRAGRIVTKDLEVEILPVEDGVLAAA